MSDDEDSCALKSVLIKLPLFLFFLFSSLFLKKNELLCHYHLKRNAGKMHEPNLIIGMIRLDCCGYL